MYKSTNFAAQSRNHPCVWRWYLISALMGATLPIWTSTSSARRAKYTIHHKKRNFSCLQNATVFPCLKILKCTARPTNRGDLFLRNVMRLTCLRQFVTVDQTCAYKLAPVPIYESTNIDGCYTTKAKTQFEKMLFTCTR